MPSLGLSVGQTAKHVKSFIGARFLKRPVPLNINFEITHRCNLRCRYCDRNRPRPAELPTAKIIEIIDRFNKMGTRGISLDGGEPLTHPDFAVIADEVAARGMVLRINSNLTLLPDTPGAIAKVDKIKVSLDGDEAHHDKMRGRGSFKKALAGIALAREMGKTVELTCVLHRGNLDSIEALLQLAEQLQTSVVFQPVRASLMDAGKGSHADWEADESALQEAFRRLLSLKADTPTIANRRASLQHFLNFPNPTRVPCAAGWLSCTIDPEGKLYHCGQVSRKRAQADLTEQDPEEAFPAMNRFACKQCWCARVVELNFAWGLQLWKLA